MEEFVLPVFVTLDEPGKLAEEPGSPEIREHRIYFWDKGIETPSSDCNAAQIGTSNSSPSTSRSRTTMRMTWARAR